MGFMDEYNELKKKRKKEEQSSGGSFMGEYNKLKEQRQAEELAEIAPFMTSATPTTTKAEDRHWFQSGVFGDGYQFGDVTKTILGTGADVWEELQEGIVNMGETTVDAGAYILGTVGGAFGAKGFQDDMQDFIKKDLYDAEKVVKSASLADPILGMMGTDVDSASLLGQKTDDVVSSGGQLLGTVGLQAVGVPWFVTTGLTSFGGEAESAFNQDATWGEAGLSAAITAGAEMLTEKISGGIKFGGNTLDDALTKQISRNISNKVVRTATKLGMDMAGEGGEEILSGLMSAVGQKITYADDKELNELFSSEDAWEAFVGGAALGGFGSGVQAVKNKVAGKDAVTGLTKTEQSVVDKVYKDRVAEADKDGKISEKEKSKIYDEVLNDLEKGYISTDIIEEVLGGESYNTYKNTFDSEDAMQKEYDELYNRKNGDKSSKDIDREAELKKLLEESKAANTLGNLKTKLGDDVLGILKSDAKGKGSRLLESYNEKARRGQAYEADLTQYDEKQQAVIQKAVDSGILNNTRRTHEFVDMVAKISADKGVLFDFTDNAKLKESGFAVDGKFVNGYVTKDGITVNIDSSKSLNSIVGHEITHVLEGTELYKDLSEAVKNYAIAKEGLNTFNNRLKSTEDMYKGVEADADAELVADLVGDYLFTDSEFITRLSTENRNIFQKVYDEIKYLYKMATAGSKEARELEKVMKAFEKAYRESGNAQGNTKYSLDDLTIDDIMKMSDEDLAKAYEELGLGKYMELELDDDVLLDDFSVESISEEMDVEPEVIKILYRRNGLGNSHVEANHAAVMTQKRIDQRIAEHGATRPDYARRYITRISPKDFIDMTVYEQNMDRTKFDSRVRGDLDSKMGEWDYEKQLHDSEEPPVLVIDKSTGQIIGHNGRHRIRALEMAGIESVEIEVELHDEDGRLIKYNSQTIPDMAISSQFDTAIETHISNIIPLNKAHRGEIGKSYGENAHPNAVVKYSISDSDGKQLSKEQQEYFKNSKMRDENGNLKVMYHGSQDAGFHTFDNLFSDDDTSFFFVDRNDVAATYSGSSEVYEARTFRSAEDFNKFFAEIGADEYTVKEEEHGGHKWFVLYEEGVEVASSETAKLLYNEFRDWAGVGYGDANYKVYLNLTNPLVVDAQGRNWNRISGEFSQEIYDRYKTLTEAEKEALIQLASWEDASVFRDELLTAVESVERDASYVDDYTRTLASAAEKLGDADKYRLFDIAADYFSEESLRENAVNYLNTRDYAKRAKEQGYDGVIFNNIVDLGGYSNGREGAATVAIAFNSNQIKSTANAKPTGDADIRYSLSDSQGRKLSKAQADYFKDSKAKDENGSLKVVYHGTRNADFTVFKRNVNYFTDSKEMADSYSPNGDMYEGYVNITKPYEIDAAGEKWSRIPIDDATRKFLQEYGASVFKEGGKWRTTPADLASAIEEAVDNGDMDYDGIIIRNIDDTGSYYKGDDTHVATDYIVFNSNQFKNADNKNPTADPDIRFSLSDAVEETKDLMALHNLTEAKLLKSLKLGGLPMPSVAIAKAKDGHGEFGEISLILPKETIDPKANTRNKLYSGDAWTPMYPQVEYKLNTKALKAISKKIDGLVPYEVQDFGRLHLDPDNMEDTLNRYGGNMVDAFKDNDALKYAYLMEAGADITLPMKEKNLSYHGSRENGAIIKVAEAIPADEISKALNGGYEEVQKLEPIVRKAVAEYVKETYGDDQFILDTFAPEDGLSFSDLDGYLTEARKYHRTGIEKTVDPRPARELIRDMTVQYSYEEWLENLFSGIVEKEGIRNNQDYFTPSGNRRSFEALHYEHNLENVVKAMREKGEKGIGNGFGGASIFGASTTEFSSIEDMKQSSDRLQMMTYEEYQELRKQFTDRFLEIAIKLPNTKNDFMATDSAAEVLTEAVAKYKTRSGIANYLRRELKGWATYSDQAVDDLIDLVNDIRKMPTGYFEAKPQRAVSFDEVGVFVIPRNADVKLKQELLNNGYAIAEYDPDVEGDRTKVLNQFEEYKFSLSDVGQKHKTYGRYNVYGKDIRLDKGIAPVGVAESETPNAPVSEQESVAPVEETSVADLFPDTPMQSLEELVAEAQDIMGAMEAYEAVGDRVSVEQLLPEYEAVMEKIGQLEDAERQRADSLVEGDIPPEMDAPYYGEPEKVAMPDDPFENREWYDIGNRKVKAYMYENPEVKPFFQEEALNLLGELNDTTRGEKWYSAEAFNLYGNEGAWSGVKRHTSASMEELLDSWHMSYADIEKGLNAIIEDNGAENIAAAKKLEFMLNDRLLHGYKDFYTNKRIPPNQDYINLLNERQINEYSKEAFDSFMAHADEYAPLAMDDTPVKSAASAVVPQSGIDAENIGPTAEVKTSKGGEVKGQQAMYQEAVQNESSKTAAILIGQEHGQKKKQSSLKWADEHIFRHGAVFEDLALATGNRELQARFDNIRRAESRAQTFIGKGKGNVSSLLDVKKAIDGAGKTKAFNEYLYHMLNVDRMTLEDRFKDTPNKPVYGDTVTAEASRKAAAKLLKENPEFKQYADEIYGINRYLRGMMVDEGVISRETAELWQAMYPHYVPIGRVGHEGLNVNVPLDTNKTGVNAPIKKATGGNSDIYDVFETMGSRISQTYKAIAKNRFGVELKNTLGTVIENETAGGVDEVLDSVDAHEELLQEGKKGQNPTFTVFENGERVKFEITDEMYEAMKPSQFTYTNKVANAVGKARRDILTTYSPTFAVTNPIKDIGDILVNSQHPARTYATIPEAIKSVIKKDHWYQERMEHGGDQDTYFDSQTKTYKKEPGKLKKIVGFPFEKIQQVNEAIEQIPRMAEYIASRRMGRSIDVSMLDAARVTTNFGAAGDFTNMLNRNGFTFLGASVEGFNQQVRNVREAKAEGLKGWGKLAGKYLAAGLPVLLLNHMLWDDDEEYEELSDYVKQNYYIVAKFDNGKFLRIPKGRAVAVIQDAFQQMENLITGNDEVDLESFGQLVVNNLSPNNPLDNNIISPLVQTMVTEKTWYGDDLVPTRLQDMPAAEQYDETTDAISKWIGEAAGKIGIDISPYKLNYLLDQYSGGVGDIGLPYLTPQADGGGFGAAFRDKFVTDSTMKNQNVTDFYDKMDELAVNANSAYATDDDVLKSKYMNAVNSELSDLYKQKREIQNSGLSDKEKNAQLREIQQQIVDLAKTGLGSYEDIRYESDGEYAIIGDKYFQWYEPEEGDPYWRKLSEAQTTKYELIKNAGDAHYVTDGNVHYRRDKNGEWTKISDKQLERQEEVTEALGITPDEYWSKTDISFLPMSDGEYEYAFDNPENYAVAKAVGGYDAYKGYSKDLYDIKADKDENGKSISGSRKEKVIDYINSMDADYGEKIILLKSQYPADDTYNYEIIEYLNGREDISYEEMETILKELGFNVSSDGDITWD